MSFLITPYLCRRLRPLAALLCCAILLVSSGCAHKMPWQPPDEPKITAPPAPPPPRVDYEIWYVMADRLNLRACPGMDCPRITVLERNQEVEKMGESQGWFQIRSRLDGSLGWVDARYLSRSPVVVETVAPPPVTPREVPPAPVTEPAEVRPRIKTPATVREQDVEEPRPRRIPAAEAAEPPRPPAPEPAPEPAPAPAAPGEPEKKRIRIM
ncbi:MAG: hypothetical protein FJ135_04090 [Deltaproteobacteria bacterium]|nr:hypothetical protein [Deltaproteobacteria bacterium]